MVVVVLELPPVEVLDPAPAALGRIDAEPLAPAAPDELEAPTAPVELAAPAALGRIEAPLLALVPVAPVALVLDDGLVVLVVDVDVVGAAARTSMNTSIWPLLAVLMNVPAVAGMLLDEVDDEDDEDDEPEAAPLLLDMNEPVHWFCVSSWV